MARPRTRRAPEPEALGPLCPGCSGSIPSNAAPGSGPGVISRFDGKTEVCRLCGRFETLAVVSGTPLVAPGRTIPTSKERTA